MQHRKGPFFLVALSAALLVSVFGCAKEPGTIVKKSESTTETSRGEVKTTSQSTQTGSALEAKTETKTDTAGPTIRGKVETYVGTVTEYVPGKKIEVLTAEKKKHTVALDAKDTVVAIDTAVAVGSRVRLTEQTGDDQARRVTVKVEG